MKAGQVCVRGGASLHSGSGFLILRGILLRSAEVSSVIRRFGQSSWGRKVCSKPGPNFSLGKPKGNGCG
ncbi:hypothetical protein AOLI_G00223920 [Acnodon oligacanthus]